MKLEEIKDIKQIEDNLVEVIYGDSVTGDTLIDTNKGKIKIEKIFNNRICRMYSERGKEFISTRDFKILSRDRKTFLYTKYIVRHRTYKDIFNIWTDTAIIRVTSDHSLMLCKSCEIGDLIVLKETSPKNADIGDIMLVRGEYEKIRRIQNVGPTTEYVYDICVDTNDENQHVFWANDILVHNTDSLYLCYDNLINTIEGSENWTDRQKTEFLAKLNQEFLDEHNRKFIYDFYKEKHGDSCHEFELETIARSGVWLNVKKRYAQILTWKDGKYYDEDDLPMKVKGLEIVKSSYPEFARNILKKLVRSLLESENIDETSVLSSLNIIMQDYKQSWLQADLESICPSVSVNKYTEYVISDNLSAGPELRPKCPFAVRGLATYNNPMSVCFQTRNLRKFCFNRSRMLFVWID